MKKKCQRGKKRMQEGRERPGIRESGHQWEGRSRERIRTRGQNGLQWRVQESCRHGNWNRREWLAPWGMVPDMEEGNTVDEETVRNLVEGQTSPNRGIGDSGNQYEGGPGSQTMEEGAGGEVCDRRTVDAR